jgi:hypothetical protein
VGVAIVKGVDRHGGCLSACKEEVHLARRVLSAALLTKIRPKI